MTEFVKHVSIEDFYNKVEEQKQAALQAPVYVFGSTISNEAIKPLLNQVSDVFKNQHLFKYYKTSDVDEVLASAVHRIMSFYFYKSNYSYQKKWLEESLKESLESTLTTDLYAVDLCNEREEDIKRLNQIGVCKFPCILVYKMGHRVYTNFMEENQESEYGKEVARHFENMRNSVSRSTEPETNVDEERYKFEQRYRERLAQEKKKEEQEKRIYMINLKKRLEEDKEERRRKFQK